MNIETATSLVKAEVERTSLMHESFHSQHEGYAVILEELDEAWDEIKLNNRSAAANEMIQVAAMAIRFLIDCG